MADNEFTVFFMAGNIAFCVDFKLLKYADNLKGKVIKPVDVVTRNATAQKTVILDELSAIEVSKKARKVARQ